MIYKGEEIRQTMSPKQFSRWTIENRPKGQTYADAERRRSKGRIKYRQCHHRVWVIDNYERKECKDCSGELKNYSVDSFQPHFNQGLGVYVESRSDFKRALKQANAVHIGDDRL